MKTQQKFDNARDGGEQEGIARLLDQRFGDGSVYLKEPTDRSLFRRAIQLGFINTEGFLTTSGFRMWQSVTEVG